MGKIRDEINAIDKVRKMFDHYCVSKQKEIQNKCQHFPEDLEWHDNYDSGFWKCNECGVYFKTYPYDEVNIVKSKI